MKSLAELRAIKEKAKAKIHARENTNAKFTIIVGMGTCGIAAGARETLKEIINQIQKRELGNDIIVTQTGCAGFCANEPMVKIIDNKGNEVIYEKLTADKVKRVFDEHIENNIVVSDFVFNINTK